MSDRIESIRGMIANDPGDVFLHYSLGMEYAAAGRHDEAVDAFQCCVRLDDAYLAAYVEAGKSLRSAGRLDEARAILVTAMELAALQGESHMRDYVQQQLDGLPRGP